MANIGDLKESIKSLNALCCHEFGFIDGRLRDKSANTFDMVSLRAFRPAPMSMSIENKTTDQTRFQLTFSDIFLFLCRIVYCFSCDAEETKNRK